MIQLERKSWEMKNKMQIFIDMMVGRQTTAFSSLDMNTKAVTTGGHKLFGIWHRWRSRDCIPCAFRIVTTWEMHLTSLKSKDVCWVYSLLIMTPLLQRLLSSQLEDKLPLKGAGIDRFHTLDVPEEEVNMAIDYKVTWQGEAKTRSLLEALPLKLFSSI